MCVCVCVCVCVCGAYVRMFICMQYTHVVRASTAAQQVFENTVRMPAPTSVAFVTCIPSVLNTHPSLIDQQQISVMIKARLTGCGCVWSPS